MVTQHSGRPRYTARRTQSMRKLVVMKKDVSEEIKLSINNIRCYVRYFKILKVHREVSGCCLMELSIDGDIYNWHKLLTRILSGK